MQKPQYQTFKSAQSLKIMFILQKKNLWHKKPPWIIHHLQSVPTLNSSLPLDKCVHVKRSTLGLSRPPSPQEEGKAQLTRKARRPEDQSHRRWRMEGTGLICLPMALLSRNQNKSHSLILRGPISKESAAINTVFLSQWKIVSGCLWAVC